MQRPRHQDGAGSTQFGANQAGVRNFCASKRLSRISRHAIGSDAGAWRRAGWVRGVIRRRAWGGSSLLRICHTDGLPWRRSRKPPNLSHWEREICRRYYSYVALVPLDGRCSNWSARWVGRASYVSFATKAFSTPDAASSSLRTRRHCAKSHAVARPLLKTISTRSCTASIRSTEIPQRRQAPESLPKIGFEAFVAASWSRNLKSASLTPRRFCPR